MKKQIITLFMLASAFTMQAQQQGGISADMLTQIKKSYSNTPTNKALMNAISSNDISKLCLNRENLGDMDTYFSDVVETKGITDQKQSGRCWLFTGLNVLRDRVIKSYDLNDFRFSQGYSYFWDQLEKSNLFLQGVIDNAKKPMDDKMVEWLFKNPLSDGGTYTGVADLVTKYGVVPSGVMPESFNTENTSRLSSLMKEKLREFGLELRDMTAKKRSQKDIIARKTEMLGTMYKMLVLSFGEPVSEFEYAFKDKDGKSKSEVKKYTPLSFYKECVAKGDDLINNYIMLMNDPSREYWKVYEIDYDRHLYDGHNWLYVNLPIEEIKPMAINSIKGKDMMYFSCDVGKSLNSSRGLLDVNNYDYGSLFGTTFSMDKKQRVQTFASGSSHAMTLVAVDLNADGKSKKWMVQNSWGETSGYKGFLIMTDKWFDEYMFRLVVNKKYVPAKVLELLKQKPVRLPAWDPMFAAEE